MIKFTQNSVHLVVDLGSLEWLSDLQNALLQLISRQGNDPIHEDYLAAVTRLLAETCFDTETLSDIEKLIRKENQERYKRNLERDRLRAEQGKPDAETA